jgi:hypothetical protein
MLARILAVTLALLAGCSNDNGNSSKDMTPPLDMTRGPLDHPPLWRLSRGTIPVQSAVELYVVVWQGDEAIGAATVDFVDWMLHSSYWTQSLGEYGVGAGVSKGLIVIPSSAPALIGDAQLQTLSAGFITSGQVTRTDNTQIHFLPPQTTKVSSLGTSSCTGFLGYHSRTGGAQGVAYSVTARCDGVPGEPIDQIADTLSHEAAEAATDVSPGNGIIDISPAHQEVADLCEFGLDAPIDVPPDATHPQARRYWVQRLYSDARAAAGTMDPCLPLPWDHPYWNVAIDPPVIAGAAGSSAPIEARLDVFAYGDVGAIKWVASSSGANVQPPSGEAHAGDTIPITVTPLSTLRSGDVIEIDMISESAKAGSQLWFGYVQAQ